jgi:hypothetical protein
VAPLNDCGFQGIRYEFADVAPYRSCRDARIPGTSRDLELFGLDYSNLDSATALAI